MKYNVLSQTIYPFTFRRYGLPGRHLALQVNCDNGYVKFTHIFHCVPICAWEEVQEFILNSKIPWKASIDEDVKQIVKKILAYEGLKYKLEDLNK